MTPTPITGGKAAPKTRGERRAELVEATNRVKEELKTATDTKSVEERKARLLARLERNESLEVAVEVALIDKDPQLVTEVLQQTSNVVAASEALAALYRSDENRAAEVLMGLDAARGAEYLRLMVDQLNDADAASALVGAEEPGRVVAVAQFLLPYGARSVLYKGKELLALVAATSPEAAKTIYAGLEYTEQVSILRRLVLGLGQRPGSEDKEEGALSRTALVDAAAFGASKPDFRHGGFAPLRDGREEGDGGAAQVPNPRREEREREVAATAGCGGGGTEGALSQERVARRRRRRTPRQEEEINCTALRIFIRT